MALRDKAWQIPLRVITGAYILDSGLTKRKADRSTAEHLHGFASSTYPPLSRAEPNRFTATLAAGEITLGSLLLLPLVPSKLAGAALTSFGAGLLGLYLRTPGMRRPGSAFPSTDGMALAKDSWLVAIGTALVLGTRSPSHRGR